MFLDLKKQLISLFFNAETVIHAESTNGMFFNGHYSKVKNHKHTSEEKGTSRLNMLVIHIGPNDIHISITEVN